MSRESLAQGANPIRLLGEAEALLEQGLRRIAQAQGDLPEAQHPICEAIALSEQQTMITLAAVEKGQEAVGRIETIEKGFIDNELADIRASFAEILAASQGQDLAGQRLKKSLALLTAVQERLQQALEELPIADAAEPTGTVEGSAVDYSQADVDALLESLGI